MTDYNLMVQALGGFKVLRLMLGVNRIIKNESTNSISFRFDFDDIGVKDDINSFFMQYDYERDLYNLEFTHTLSLDEQMKDYENDIERDPLTVIKRLEGIHVESVKKIFEDTTGLYLTIPRFAW